MGTVLLVIGALAAAVGAIGILIAAFHEGVGWGLASLFVPLVALVFVVTHWEKTKKPFLLKLAGVGVMIAGAAMSGPRGPME